VGQATDYQRFDLLDEIIALENDELLGISEETKLDMLDGLINKETN